MAGATRNSLAVIDDDDPLGRTELPPSRRRLAYALLATVAVIAVVAALLAGPGGEATDDAGDPTGIDIGALLTTQAQGISGLLPADALARAECNPAELGVYECIVDASNVAGVAGTSRRGQTTVVRMEIIDGRVVKDAGGLDAAPQSAAEAGRAIASDDRTTLRLQTAWACGFSSGLNPDGSRADDSPGGFRCVQTKGPTGGADAPTERYVEFRDDGRVAKDFVIASAASADAPASAGPGRS